MRTIVIILVVAAAAANAQTDSTAGATLREVESLYNRGEYIAAEVVARRYLEQPALTDSVKVLCDKWIAFSLIAQEKKTLAQGRFMDIFDIDPTFELDPVLTSPKILTVFNDARSAYHTRVMEGGRDDDRFVHGPRPAGITYRTILFPGWEQLHQGRDTEGYIFLSAGALTLAGGIAFEALRADARKRYLNATSLADISSKYNTYNRYRNAELYSFISFAVVYLASELDVISSNSVNPSSVSVDFPPRATTLFSVSVPF